MVAAWDIRNLGETRLFSSMMADRGYEYSALWDEVCDVTTGVDDVRCHR